MSTPDDVDSFKPISLLESLPVAGPSIRLFSPRMVAIACFLGSVLAGSVLLGLNYRRLGNRDAAVLSVFLGALATGALLVAALVTPDGPGITIAFALLNIGILVVVWKIAEMLQGEAVWAHRLAGGRLGSRWAVAGVGLSGLAAFQTVLFSVVFVAEYGDLGQSLQFGKSNIYYKDGVTEQEARGVAQELLARGWFERDQPSDVQIVRREGTPHVIFVVDDEAFTDRTVAAGMSDIGAILSRVVFQGAGVVVELADEQLEIHRSIPVRRD